MANVFVDSTTLLYPMDSQAQAKGPLARAWLRRLRADGRLEMSPQVLNEAYWVGSRKPAFAATRTDLRPYLSAMAGWATAPLDAATLAEAWVIQDRYRLGFWDSLLLASANLGGCSHFLSEDLNDGQLYGDVTVVNPFRHRPEDVLGPPVLAP